MTMPSKVWITTYDNPYDPFTQFDDWYNFDESSGYRTCSYLARLAPQSADFEDINDFLLEDAINEIIQLHGGEIYKKVKNYS